MPIEMSSKCPVQIGIDPSTPWHLLILSCTNLEKVTDTLGLVLKLTSSTRIREVAQCVENMSKFGPHLRFVRSFENLIFVSEFLQIVDFLVADRKPTSILNLSF